MINVHIYFGEKDKKPVCIEQPRFMRVPNVDTDGNHDIRYQKLVSENDLHLYFFLNELMNDNAFWYCLS